MLANGWGPAQKESRIFQHRKKYLKLNHIKKCLKYKKGENQSRIYIKIMQLSLALNLQATDLLLQYICTDR